MRFAEDIRRRIWNYEVDKVKVVAHYPDGSRQEYPLSSKGDYLSKIPRELRVPIVKDVYVGYTDTSTSFIQEVVKEEEIWVRGKEILEDIKDRVALIIIQYEKGDFNDSLLY